MRKISFLLLVICLLLASVPACAEKGQLLTDGSFTYELPMNWEIVQVVDDGGISMSQLAPQHAEDAIIVSIDYEAFPELLQVMETKCKDHTEKFAHHMSEAWTILGGNKEMLVAILNGQSESGVCNLIDDGRGGIMVTTFDMDDTGIRVQIMFFQLVENAGYVIAATAALPADDTFEAAYEEVLTETLMVHLSAKPANGSADETASGSAMDEDASDKVAACVVITADSGKIRTEASISGGHIKTAYKGETFELIREEGDWYVVDVNGRTGYIHKGVAAIQ